jgi:16S rRNA (guanine527-N7)-methyltransferase
MPSPFDGREDVPPPARREMEILRAGARTLGLHLTGEHVQSFQVFFEELRVWNRRFNLTTVTRYEDVQVKHFLDSLTCLLAFPAGSSDRAECVPNVVPLTSRDAPLLCVDVGTGAGFPGLPLKIMRPALRMTLLESSRKKVSFLRHVVERLGLEGVEFLWARAEEVGQDPRHRERFDLALARAVADMTVLVEYCLPLCRKGGCFVAQKGMDVETELTAALPAIQKLGGRVREVKRITLPGLREPRTLVLIDKVHPTPIAFPRRPGMPSKRPLTGG